MDWNDTPGSLDTKLLEKGGGDDGAAGGEGVGIKESTSDYTDKDDAEATAEDLTTVSNDGTTGHGTQVCDDLGDGDLIGGEVVLVGKHCRVKILRTMGLRDLSVIILLDSRREGLTMKLKPAISKTR